METMETGIHIVASEPNPSHPSFSEDAWGVSPKGHIALCDGVSNFHPKADIVGLGMHDFRSKGSTQFFIDALASHKSGDIRRFVAEVEYICGFRSGDLDEEKIKRGVDKQPGYNLSRVEKFMSPSGFLARKLAQLLSDVGPLEGGTEIDTLKQKIRNELKKDPDMLDVAKYYIDNGPSNNDRFVVSSTFAVVDTKTGKFTKIGDILISDKEISMSSKTKKLGETDALAVIIFSNGEIEVLLDEENLVQDVSVGSFLHVATDGVLNTDRDDVTYIKVRLHNS